MRRPTRGGRSAASVRTVPDMARGSSRPSVRASIVVVVGVLAVAVGLSFAGGRGQPSAAEVRRLEAAAAERREADATASDTAEPARVLVIGDSYTSGYDGSGIGSAGWARLAERDLRADGGRLHLDVAAAGGSGYVAAGPSGNTFADLAEQAAPGYDLAVFFGSRNDTADGSEVEAAAGAAYAAVQATSPDVRLLVIGPPWVDSDPPDDVLESRDALAAASRAVGATFVDPLEEGWFGGDAGSLIGSDGVHPTDEGYRYMADLIVPRLSAELDALGTA